MIAIKRFFLSVLYILIAIFLLFLVDIGLYYFITDVVVYILDWFNGIRFFFKLLLIFIGGFSIFIALLQVTQRVSTILGGLIFNKFPYSPVASGVAMLIALLNALWNIIWLWRVPNHYNFWVICELIVLSSFVVGLSAIVLPARDQIEEYKKQDSL
jgi:hypothetical protein